MPDHTIRPGNVYESCDPHDNSRIRIVSYTPGSNSANVVDADTGRRPRWVLVSWLHAKSATPDGRTGYRLVEESGDADIPNVRPGQVWADNDKRYEGRTLRVERVYGGIVLCRILTNTDVTQGWIDRKNPHVHDRRGKTISIALDRFRPTSTGYRLIQEASDA